eukprot:1091269-Prymnesium_polylepis.1
MPPTIEPTVPNEVYWEHWFSNLMAEGEANERLKREDPATYEAKMRAQLPTSQRPSAASAGAARPSRATATTPTPCATTVWRATRATGRSWCRSASASGRCEPRRPGRSATGGARTSTGRRGSAAPGRSRGRFGGTGRWTVTEGAGGICGLSRAQRACRSKLPQTSLGSRQANTQDTHSTARSLQQPRDYEIVSRPAAAVRGPTSD